ncbi:MAG: alkaline shock response membrane anchor protein AmaP [Clostridia bacterium]
MKGFEKGILVFFSVIMLLFSVFVVLISTELIGSFDIFNKVESLLINYKIPALISGVLVAILGLIGLFSTSGTQDDMRSGLAIKSENGTVFLTRETFESIIFCVTKHYNELKNVKVEISILESGVVANIYAMILPDTVVAVLAAKLQENIKSSVLKQTTVEIKEANIKIRGTYIEPQKK